MTAPFVPEDFDPPAGLATDDFVLEPLGPQHNERDHAAWTSSMAHIHETPGFFGREHDDEWPVPMSLAENLKDLEGHAADFAARRGFTYTVLDPADEDVIGCVYLYPSKDRRARRARAVVGTGVASRAGRGALARGRRLARHRLAFHQPRLRPANAERYASLTSLLQTSHRS